MNRKLHSRTSGSARPRGTWGRPWIVSGKARSAWLGSIAIPVAVFVAVVSADELEMTRWTIDGGGVMFSTDGRPGGFKLSGTIGQPDAGTLSGDGYTLHGGFWHPAGPCSVVSTFPPDCAIDARQPSEPNGDNPAGLDWNSCRNLARCPVLLSPWVIVFPEAVPILNAHITKRRIVKPGG